MINKINGWAQGIIIAIIIGIVITMILPESKNKKYIKVIIGIYVLFCIINPVVGNSITLDEKILEKYLNMQSNLTNTNSNYDENVKTIFIENTKKAIKQQLNSKKYDSNNISVETNNEYKILHIRIYDVFEYKEKSSIINEVEINISEKRAKGIAISDKNDIINDLSEKYGVSKNNIEID